jgi:hypothetical protein
MRIFAATKVNIITFVKCCLRFECEWERRKEIYKGGGEGRGRKMRGRMRKKEDERWTLYAKTSL